MADLTFQQRFGTHAAIIDDDGHPALKVRLTDLQDIPAGGDFTNGLGLDLLSLNVNNPDEIASRLLWALLQLSRQNQPEDNNDETVGIYITNEGRRNAVRNQVAQYGFRLTATGYKLDTEGLELDPDAIGA